MDLKTTLQDKNVILVGPSGSVQKDCENLDVDSFDVVVRLNNHWKMKLDGIGKRTDIICHSLLKWQYNKSDLEQWKNDGTILLTRNDFGMKAPNKILKNRIDVYNSLNKNIKFTNMTSIPNSFFESSKKTMNSNPNTGVLCILYLASMPIKSLTIVGFDFYDTYYATKKNEAHRQNIKNGKVSNQNQTNQLQYLKKFIKEDDRIKPVGVVGKLLV